MFHVSNLAVLNFRIFLLMYPVSETARGCRLLKTARAFTPADGPDLQLTRSARSTDSSLSQLVPLRHRSCGSPRRQRRVVGSVACRAARSAKVPVTDPTRSVSAGQVPLPPAQPSSGPAIKRPAGTDSSSRQPAAARPGSTHHRQHDAHQGKTAPQDSRDWA